jgi:hypothetical protein
LLGIGLLLFPMVSRALSLAKTIGIPRLGCASLCGV